MRKIYIFLCAIILSCFFVQTSFAANCTLMPNKTETETTAKGEEKVVLTTQMLEGDVGNILQDCLKDTSVYVPGDEGVSIEGGLRTTILEWTKTIAVLLGLLSVFGIVLGSLRFTLSGGNDDGITKGKNIIKWSILGVLVVMFASTIVVLIVNIFYSI